MVARGWYTLGEYPNTSKHDWAKYRVEGDKFGVFNKKDWSNKSAMQKCVWYYSIINSTIEKDLNKLSSHRWKHVDLYKIEELKYELLSFVGLKPYEIIVNQLNVIKEKDKSRKNKIDNSYMERDIQLELELYKK